MVSYQIKCLKDMHRTYRRVTFDIIIIYLVIFMMFAMLAQEFIFIQQAALFLIKTSQSQIMALICINMIQKSLQLEGTKTNKCEKIVCIGYYSFVTTVNILAIVLGVVYDGLGCDFSALG